WPRTSACQGAGPWHAGRQGLPGAVIFHCTLPGLCDSITTRTIGAFADKRAACRDEEETSHAAGREQEGCTVLRVADATRLPAGRGPVGRGRRALADRLGSARPCRHLAARRQLHPPVPARRTQPARYLGPQAERSLRRPRSLPPCPYVSPRP